VKAPEKHVLSLLSLITIPIHFEVIMRLMTGRLLDMLKGSEALYNLFTFAWGLVIKSSSGA